jgi:hypothetical protein
MDTFTLITEDINIPNRFVDILDIMSKDKTER